jgi:uncharacterized protein
MPDAVVANVRTTAAGRVRPLDIAVVGSGIAGLVAAWRLASSPAGHRVTLFERQGRIGFTASSVELHGLRVDVPLRVFYPGYYPRLTALYAELGVVTEAVSYASTFSAPGQEAYFRWRNVGLGGRSWPLVAPQDLLGRGGGRARRIAFGALALQKALREAAPAGRLQGLSIGRFVAEAGIAPECLQGLLWPALATIATCTVADAQAMPAEWVAGYWGAGLARQSVRRAVHGADDVAQRLVQPLARVVLDAGVEQVAERDGAVWLGRRAHDSEGFDHVVLATHAHQALALWPGAPAAEAALLARLPTHTLRVLMHTDTRLMPQQRRHWSPVHAWVDPAAAQPESTIWLNAVHPALARSGVADVFQTVMPQREPRAEMLLAEARFERARVTLDSQAALAALLPLWRTPASPRKVWLVGSYAEAGVPLLESAVASALAAAAAIDAAAGVVAAPLPSAPGAVASARALINA